VASKVDPVAARLLRDAMGMGGPGVDSNRSFSEYTISVAARAIQDLAEQGYVLVNAEGLRRAYCAVKHGGQHAECNSYYADAILAAISADKEEEHD